VGEPCRHVGKLAADLHGAARREDGNAYDTTRDAIALIPGTVIEREGTA
jgi:hypothetical protein